MTEEVELATDAVQPDAAGTEARQQVGVLRTPAVRVLSVGAVDARHLVQRERAALRKHPRGLLERPGHVLQLRLEERELPVEERLVNDVKHRVAFPVAIRDATEPVAVEPAHVRLAPSFRPLRMPASGEQGLSLALDPVSAAPREDAIRRRTPPDLSRALLEAHLPAPLLDRPETERGRRQVEELQELGFVGLLALAHLPEHERIAAEEERVAPLADGDRGVRERLAVRPREVKPGGGLPVPLGSGGDVRTHLVPHPSVGLERRNLRLCDQRQNSKCRQGERDRPHDTVSLVRQNTMITTGSAAPAAATAESAASPAPSPQRPLIHPRPTGARAPIKSPNAMTTPWQELR